MASSLLFALFLIAQVIAVKITTPTATSNWTSPGPNTITWTTSSGDPLTFNIQLAQNNVSSFTPNLALPADGMFGEGISISALINIFVPSCVAGSPSLPTGSGFTLKFLEESADGTETVIATSEAFNITEASVTQCAQLTTGSVPPIPIASLSSAAAASTGTAVGSLSTSSTTSHLGAIIGSTIGGLIFLLLASGVGLWMYKGRKDRRRKTAQFGMKVTQRIPQMEMQGRAQAREDV